MLKKVNKSLFYYCESASKDHPWSMFAKFFLEIYPEGELTKEFLIWKHVCNPAGPSVIAWVMHGPSVVGFRAFWKVPMVKDGKKLVGYQPCDTAVSESYRGYGIFSEMTRKALEVVRKVGNPPIFNFPNPKSRDGYFKLGWRSAGNLSKYVHCSRPLGLSLRSVREKWWRFAIHSIEPCICLKECDLEVFTSSVSQVSKFELDRKIDYLRWRLLERPCTTYGVARWGRDRLIYRVYRKSAVRIVEIIACSMISTEESFKKVFQDVLKIEKPHFVVFFTKSMGPVLKKAAVFVRIASSVCFVRRDLSDQYAATPIKFEPLLIDTR